MSTYQGALPPRVKLDPRIPDFFARFYAISDNPSEASHEEYANSVTKDGTLIMGIKEATGYDDILALRKGLWSGPVKTRLHHLLQIFPFGEDGKQVMLHGYVEYGLKNGKDITVNWAARAVMTEVEGGKLKMKHYQVYLDSAAVTNALKD